MGDDSFSMRQPSHARPRGNLATGVTRHSEYHIALSGRHIMVIRWGQARFMRYWGQNYVFSFPGVRGRVRHAMDTM